MKIHETTQADGSLSPVRLEATGDGLALIVADEPLPLPAGAVAAVMKRFGRPLDPAAELTVVDTLELEDGRLRHVRHLAIYDVIALDYLVYERPNEEPLCALATMVAGAFEHLGRAAARRLG